MLDSLSLLLITFAVMSVVSVVGVILLFLVKNEKVKHGLFYFLAVWGMIISYCNVRSNPPYMGGQIILALVFGALSVAALLIQLCVKNENKEKFTKILVVISVVAGMIDCFMF